MSLLSRSRKCRSRRLAVSLVALAPALSVACNATRTGELEPRYVAVHNTLAAMGLAQIGPIQQGSLAEGRETRLRLDLGAQCTTIVVIGSPGARDVDVALLDADDKPIAHDTTKEPQATVRTCPEAAGRYTLVVKMSAGAGEFMAATWTGGTGGSAPSGGTSPSALANLGAGTCESPLPLAPGPSAGNTRRGESETTGGCASSESKELVYKLDVARRQRVSIEVDPQFDSVLYVRKDDCGDAEAEIACNDDATAGSGKRGASSRGSRIDEVLDPGTYYVFVDGYGAESGPFRMNVQVADVPTLAEACRQPRPLGPAKISGTLTGSFDHAHASCGADAKGPDAIHRLDIAARGRVRITEHSADFTPVLHVRKQCGDEHSEVLCADSALKSDEATWPACSIQRRTCCSRTPPTRTRAAVTRSTPSSRRRPAPGSAAMRAAMLRASRSSPRTWRATRSSRATTSALRRPVASSSNTCTGLLGPAGGSASKCAYQAPSA